MTRRSNGGGWGTGPQMISPGYLVNQQYDGPGKDCAGVPVRPGYMDMYSSSGLPGLSGGQRKRRTLKYRRGRRHGGTVPNVADFLNPQDSNVYPPLTSQGVNTVSAPGVPDHSMPQAMQPQAMQPQAMQPQAMQPQASQMQAGGRYGIFPGDGPLNPVNGVGASGIAPFSRIGCESGSVNMLNSQEMHTATTASDFFPTRGGKRSKRSGSKRSGSKRSNSKRNRRSKRTKGGANFPVVHVGAADSMRYNAPTAGYRNDFEPFAAGSAVPGLTLQTPYDARGDNMACAKTGGSRRVRFGGAMGVADLAPYSSVKMEDLSTRQDFDGSSNGLPVKYGGFFNKFLKKQPKIKCTRKHKKHGKKTRKSFFGF